MSWNKNTVVTSSVDVTVRVLEQTKTPYTLVELGKVNGNGLNDSLQFDGGYASPSTYPIRRLEYGDTIIIEQMVRHPDCDVDDLLESFEFQRNEEPFGLPLEITTDENSTSPENNEQNREKLARAVVSTWDHKSLIEQAIHTLTRDYLNNDHFFQEDWAEFGGPLE